MKEYKYQHEGWGFSLNAHKAYLRGERPMILCNVTNPDSLEPTDKHHIQKLKGDNRLSFPKVLVQFYRIK